MVIVKDRKNAPAFIISFSILNSISSNVGLVKYYRMLFYIQIEILHCWEETFKMQIIKVKQTGAELGQAQV